MDSVHRVRDFGTCHKWDVYVKCFPSGLMELWKNRQKDLRANGDGKHQGNKDF